MQAHSVNKYTQMGKAALFRTLLKMILQQKYPDKTKFHNLRKKRQKKSQLQGWLDSLYLNKCILAFHQAFAGFYDSLPSNY